MRFHSRHLPLALILFTLAALAQAGLYTDSAAWQEAVKPADQKNSAFEFVVANPELPNVLIIGDSISIGYTPAVRQALAERANIYRIPENCADTSYGLRRVDPWLGDVKWSVIHFNFGLHDLKYLDPRGKYDVQNGKVVATPEQYAKNLDALVRRLKATGARLIFATTTPVPDASAGRIQGSEALYNEAARRVMADQGVAINDLCGAVKPELATHQLPHNVHFTPAGSSFLGAKVAAAIEKSLAKP